MAPENERGISRESATIRFESHENTNGRTTSMGAVTLDQPVPGDSSGRALGIGFRDDDFEKVLRPGLKTVQATMPSLADKAEEILQEVDHPATRLDGLSLIKVDRKVDEKQLKRGKVKVIDCDKRKILALVAALGYEGSGLAGKLMAMILENLTKGGIPIKIDGEPKLGGSVFIRILDESLELRLVRPA